MWRGGAIPSYSFRSHQSRSTQHSFPANPNFAPRSASFYCPEKPVGEVDVVHYKTNRKADRTGKNDTFNAQYFG